MAKRIRGELRVVLVGHDEVIMIVCVITYANKQAEMHAY